MAALDENHTFVADPKFFDVVRELTARGWRALPLSRANERAGLRWRNLANTDFDAVDKATLVNHVRGMMMLSNKGQFARLMFANGSAGYFPACYDMRSAAHVDALVKHAIRAAAEAVLRAIVEGAPAMRGDAAIFDACVRACDDAPCDDGLWATIFGPCLVAAIDGTTPLEGTATTDAEAVWARFTRGGDVISASAVRRALAAVDRGTNKLKVRARDPDRTRACWLVKPAGGSCGRGIVCAATVADAVRCARAASWRCVVQKYIERPLLVRRRKFDLRQWALVTSVDPLLVIFGFSECYARFAAAPYEEASLHDRFAHLCNYSVQKDAPMMSDDATMIPENMLTSRALAAHLPAGAWRDRIMPQVRALTVAACAAAARTGALAKEARGFEWLGLDVMLADDLTAWLVEVNVSPDVSHSTEVTSNLVPLATADCLKLLIDERQADTDPPACPTSRLLDEKNEDDGGAPPRWELWHKIKASSDDGSSHRDAAPTAEAEALIESVDEAARTWDALSTRLKAALHKTVAAADDSDDDEL